jgi:UDP-GlcNAc3NAcA epimerase
VKVLSVVGNRPQFIKSGPLSLALRDAAIEEVVVHTGQHYDRELSQIFFDELGLAEAINLDLRTSEPEEMRKRVKDLVKGLAPDCVIVFGDTNSTLAGAWAAAELSFPIAHVEAGLRSGDLSMPEERTRMEVDRLASLLFCPDERSAETLVIEGVPGRIEVVGDVMLDALQMFMPIAGKRSSIHDRLQLINGYLVATVHRAANVVEPRLGRIVDGLNRLNEPVVFPAHPRTKDALERCNTKLGEHVRLTEPLGYLDFAALCSQARVILTDSGGLQKETYWHGVPCVTLRPSTEWVDTVEVGANVLVDDNPGKLAAAVANARPLPADRPSLYGDGRASARITELLGRLFPR